MPGKVWVEFTYPFSTVEVWEWITNFIQHFIMGSNYLWINGVSFHGSVLFDLLDLWVRLHVTVALISNELYITK